MNVRAIRIRRHMKQGELARLAGISQGYLCDIEHGKATPSLWIAVRLASILGTTLTTLTKECRQETDLSKGGESTGQKRSGERQPGRGSSSAKKSRARA